MSCEQRCEKHVGYSQRWITFINIKTSSCLLFKTSIYSVHLLCSSTSNISSPLPSWPPPALATGFLCSHWGHLCFPKRSPVLGWCNTVCNSDHCCSILTTEISVSGSVNHLLYWLERDRTICWLTVSVPTPDELSNYFTFTAIETKCLHSESVKFVFNCYSICSCDCCFSCHTNKSHLNGPEFSCASRSLSFLHEYPI